MSRPGARLELRPRLFRWCESSGGTIKAIDHHLVSAEIRGERMAFGVIEYDAMRVWILLLFFDARSFVLLDIDHHSQCAIRPDRQNRNTPAGVIRNQQRSSPAVDYQMTRIGPSGCLFVQPTKIAGDSIDGEGAHAATRFSQVITDFIDCIEIAFAAIDCEKRRVGRFESTELGQCAAGAIHAITVNTFALA